MIVDASVVVQVALQDELGQRLGERLLSAGELASPHIIDLELAQALRRYVGWGEMSEERARQAIADFASLPLERFSHELLLRRVWELRDNFTAYDAAYVALAELLDAPLWTLDRRLARAAARIVQVEDQFEPED